MDARLKRLLLLAPLLSFPSWGWAGAGGAARSPKTPSASPRLPAALSPSAKPPLAPPAGPASLPLLPPAEAAARPLLPAEPGQAPRAAAEARGQLGAIEAGLASSAGQGGQGAGGVYDGSVRAEEAAAAAPDGRAAVPDGAGRRSSRPNPNFYNRQNPAPAQKPQTRKHAPAPRDTARARESLLRLGEAGDEIFNAPTWLEKAYFPELKATVFGIAFLDEALTDFANGQEADVPADLPHGEGALDALLERRAALVARYRAERARIEALPRAPAQKLAWRALESWHRRGLLSSFLDNPDALKPWPFRRAAMLFRQMRKIALGRNKKAGEKTVRGLSRQFDAALREGLSLSEARRADEALAAAALLPKASPAEAKKIYDGAVGEAKNGNLASNQAHLAARAQAARLGTAFVAPNLGKQIRPTCTVHMLQSLLASMGVHRGLETLVAEARVLLDDPFVGMTTAFTLEMQQRLFKHYGRVGLLKEGFFETIAKRRRPLKVGIEIGDPVYKHSLLLEGFYAHEGRTFVALRDSTSYFPIRLGLEDFARILTGDEAVLFLEAYDRPHGLAR